MAAMAPVTAAWITGHDPITTGVKCEGPDCTGELLERKGRGGRIFYGCTNYPKCTFIARKLPEETKEGEVPAQGPASGS